MKRPDFTIRWGGVDCFFDVKDREGSDDNSPVEYPSAAEAEEEPPVCRGVDPPYRWIREQVEQGRRKFKEFKGSPCSIVMFSANGWGHDLLENDFVLGAMYGDYGLVVPLDHTTGRFDATKAESRYLDGGKMIRPGWRAPQNTTLSALITLRSVDVGRARLDRYVGENFRGAET